MNEKGSKRREWVKNAAIIFLVVLLLLTFFSNTIMNYSLPEVAAQYVQSGSITAKIRGTGTVESGDPYKVEVKESRKVKSVAVRAGDVVQKGDVLLYLEDTESEELKAAQKELKEKKDALDNAWNSYDVALLTADVTSSVIQNANSDKSTNTYRQQITNAQSAYNTAKTKADDLQKQYDKIASQITLAESANANMEKEVKAYNDAKKANDNAQIQLTAANNNYNYIKSQLDYQLSVSDGDAASETTINNLTAQLQQAERTKIDLERTANATALQLQSAENAMKSKLEGTTSDLTKQQTLVKINLDNANLEVTKKETELNDLVKNINQTLNLGTLYNAVEKAQEELDEVQLKVDEETEKSVNAVVEADIAGTVSTVNITAGETTSPENPVVTLQPEGKGFTMSFSVTNDQAKRLSVGTKADLVNAWRYDGVSVTLASIKPDPTDPSQKKLLMFDVTGDILAGQSLSVSVGDKSANYDTIVPNSAIREDNNGKFILVVESKSSPLGNRYVATRVDVEVIANDETQSAVTGALYGSEFVITTSTKPVEAGKLVRLSNDN